jgi:serine/threonine protein kinase/tetratricopeptide (TPR) repeat protein
MSETRLKEKQKKSAKLYEACDVCGKAKNADLGSTVTRWVFGLQTCNCKPQEPRTTCELVPVEPSKQPSQQTPTGKNGNQANKTAVDLGDRYEILETIGQGGMGTVYRVKDKVLGKEFAIKVLRDDFATDETAIKRFEQEADAASELTHPNMLATYGRGCTATGSHYIVMDLLEGESLSQLLKRETKLEAAQVINISTQICDALAHAHMKGLIHRDLKPSNIMLTDRDHGLNTVKVLDFGIAKLMPTSNRETQNLTETGDLFGSPSYMSPEQCLGFAVDARSDIYSLGCMMYEMFSGQPPFAGKNPVQTVVKHLNEQPPPLKRMLPSSRISARLESVIMRCLEKDASHRYQSMDQLKADLQLVALGKSPKQGWKPSSKSISLPSPVITTVVLLAIMWIVSQPAAIYGDVGLPPYLQDLLPKCAYILFVLCALLWVAVLGQLCWGQIKKSAPGNNPLHEKWKAATLAWLFIGLLSAVGLGCSSTDPIWPRPPADICTYLMLVADLGFIMATVTSIGWAFTRTAAAFKLSAARQRLVNGLYIAFLGSFLIFGRPLIAWFPFAAAVTSITYPADKYRPNPGLELAILINPNFAEAYYKRAHQKRAWDVPGAVDDMTKALDLHPNRDLEAQIRRDRAELFARSGDFKKAISDITRVTELEAPSTFSQSDYMTRARYYESEKQYPEALADYDKVHNSNPEDPQFDYLGRAQLHERLGNLAQALSDYSSAIEWDPYKLYSYFKRAALYRKLGQPAQGMEDYKTIVQRHAVLKRLARPTDDRIAQRAEKELALMKHGAELGPVDANVENVSE